MPEILDHIAYLSQEIGPRPAGTEEEQQAALYITEQLQKQAELPAIIEDFSGSSNAEIPAMILGGISTICAIVALILPSFAIPAIIVTLIVTIVTLLESTGRPALSNLFTRSVSQNVVAKYEPKHSSGEPNMRRRKVILLAHYDTGKVRAELKGGFLGLLPKINLISFLATVLLPIFLLIRFTVFVHAAGVLAIIFTVIMAIIILFVAIPVLLGLLHKAAAYNEGANCNASGVAVLLDVASRLEHSRLTDADLDGLWNDAVVHGESAAYSQGVVPEGASLSYEAPTSDEAYDEDDPEGRLLAAKAAVAALTGKPVSMKPAYDMMRSSVQESVSSSEEASFVDGAEKEEDSLVDSGVESAFSALEDAVLPEGEPQLANEGDVSASIVGSESTEEDASQSQVPDWFKKAQAKAKKTDDDTTKVQRSRYADALDAAVGESSSYFTQATQVTETALEDQLRQLQDGIQEVKAPRFDRARGPQDVAMISVVDQEASSDLVTEAVSSVNEGVSEQAVVSISERNDDQLTAVATVEDSGTEAKNGLPLFSDLNIDMSAQAIDSAVDAAAAAPVVDTTKQRAPLDEARASNENAAKSLLTMLPSLSGAIAPVGGLAEKQASKTNRAELRTTLPSLSGTISRQSIQSVQPEEDVSDSVVGAAGSFGAAGMTGAFAPVGDELLENVDPQDVYVEDADDSDYAENFTETGAFAGPGYVEMPKSRVGGLFGRLRKKKKFEEEPSTQEWLDVDENFDAREVGKARGSWESFQQDDENLGATTAWEPLPEDAIQQDIYEEAPELDYGNVESWNQDGWGRRRDRWNGGAFSRLRLKRGGKSAKDNKDDAEEGGLKERGRAGRRTGSNADDLVSSDIGRIQSFRRVDLNTEVWFVALGSDLAGQSGMKAFLAEHAQELRGSILIELEALGAGDLSLIEKEGFRRTVKSSSRMSRYVGKASRESGVFVEKASIPWRDSATSFAALKGLQAMHLAGMDKTKPACFAEKGDTVDKISEEKLAEASDFVIALLKSI